MMKKEINQLINKNNFNITEVIILTLFLIGLLIITHFKFGVEYTFFTISGASVIILVSLFFIDKIKQRNKSLAKFEYEIEVLRKSTEVLKLEEKVTQQLTTKEIEEITKLLNQLRDIQRENVGNNTFHWMLKVTNFVIQKKSSEFAKSLLKDLFDSEQKEL